MSMRLSLIVAALVLLLAASTHADLFLRINSIPGTSQAAGRKDWLDVQKFGIGVRATDEAGQPITPRPTPLRIEGSSSTSSPLIFAGVVNGTHFDPVRLEITRPGPTPAVLAYWELVDATIISYQTAGDDQGSVTEQYDIAPQGSVTYGFNELNAGGAIIGNVEFKWNLMAGTASTVTTGTVTGFQFLSGDADISDLGPVIRPPLPGDYDRDGDVDNADYSVWKSQFGSKSLLNADGNNNGTVDAADYVVWRRNLDLTPTAPGQGAAPEPRSIVMLLALSISHLIAARRRF
ncbi:MAG TPA: type VI secretion system tube protein Hcp [Lacipirellulaceae bacterium]|jgi:type VI protein secretion system component Hcp|nr:type VI secretion system tube protein Hcp [Lacipirellulaceae bacterium]